MISLLVKLRQLIFFDWLEFDRTSEVMKSFGMNSAYIYLEYIMIVFWLVVYSILLFVWFRVAIKKKENAKPIIAGVMLICALLTSFTDSIETSIYISDVVVGTEIIEQH